MSFDSLGLSQSLMRAIREKGYEHPTPIQASTIPAVLAGRDLMGCAQTGTGKTAAFALPIIDRLHKTKNEPFNATKRHHHPGYRPIRAVVLAPTRELAAQINESFVTYGRNSGLRFTTVYGGVSQNPQVRALDKGVDVLIATPGRLLDLMNQGFVELHNVKILVLDEADQMLDMGFLPDLKRIVSAVPQRDQTLMFSATMPAEIKLLADKWLRNPEHIQVTPAATTVKLVKQSVYFVDSRNKPQLLAHYLQTNPSTRALVFARTKHGADKIVKHLVKEGIKAAAIHGNKSQNARMKTLEQFKSEKPPVLVATDIAARGLDVRGISHVINYELPEVAETYVHRIGRTGRAGATGFATSFCAVDERQRLTRIERLTKHRISVHDDHPEYVNSGPAVVTSNERPPRHGSRPQSRSGQSQQRSGQSQSRSGQSRSGQARSGQSNGRPSRAKAQGNQSHGHQAQGDQGGNGYSRSEAPVGDGAVVTKKAQGGKPRRPAVGEATPARPPKKKWRPKIG
jgi:ATP-dependent RNA helicase RhlE